MSKIVNLRSLKKRCEVKFRFDQVDCDIRAFRLLSLKRDLNVKRYNYVWLLVFFVK